MLFKVLEVKFDFFFFCFKTNNGISNRFNIRCVETVGNGIVENGINTALLNCAANNDTRMS